MSAVLIDIFYYQLKLTKPVIFSIKSEATLVPSFFFNQNSFHVRLKIHYKAWNYKNEKNKKIKKMQESWFERPYKKRVSVNSRHKAI